MIISVQNSKGGQAKSQTAIQTALGLARRGHDVCLCDMDSQHDLTDMVENTIQRNYGYKRRPMSSMMQAISTGDLSQSLVKLTGKTKDMGSIMLLASSSDFWQYQRWLDGKFKSYKDRVMYLPRLFDKLFKQYKFDDCVFDTSPTRSVIIQSVTVLSQLIIIPMTTTTDAYKGARACLEFIEDTYKAYGGNLQNINVLMTEYSRRNSRDRAIYEQATKDFGADSMLPTIKYQARFKRYSSEDGVPLRDLDYFDRKAIGSYDKVVDAILKENK